MIWLTTNWVEVMAIATAVILLAGRLSELTAWKGDDIAVAKVKRLVQVLGMKPKDPK